MSRFATNELYQEVEQCFNSSIFRRQASITTGTPKISFNQKCFVHNSGEVKICYIWHTQDTFLTYTHLADSII